MNIKIGSRKSKLAIAQTEAVINNLREIFHDDKFEIVGISTQGDIQKEKSLKSFGQKGVFIKEIELALLKGEIDMAVHSAKDMPVQLPDGLEIGAALLCADRRDVLVCFGDTKTEDIKTIGTGSARRALQAKELFPNAVFKEIRGNIPTRLEKVKNGEYDAVIMAKAAIDRLGITDVNIISLGSDFICAPGQGIIAVETRSGKMKKYTDAINEPSSMSVLIAERTFLEHTGGGCHAPCGAWASGGKDKITMRTFYGDTKSIVRLEDEGIDPVELGIEMARRTLEKAREE